MAKRFSDLDKALRYIRVGEGQNARSVPPAGSPLETYQKYKKGDLIVEYPRTGTDSNPGNIITAVINPFAVPAGPDNLTIVAFSDRARREVPGSNLLTACKHTTPLPDPLPEARAGFIPAKVTIFVPEEGTSPKTSKLTGIDYRKRNGASYTYPYGKSTGTPNESQVRSDILTALGGNAFEGTASFQSENY